MSAQAVYRNTSASTSRDSGLFTATAPHASSIAWSCLRLWHLAPTVTGACCLNWYGDISFFHQNTCKCDWKLRSCYSNLLFQFNLCQHLSPPGEGEGPPQKRSARPEANLRPNGIMTLPCFINKTIPFTLFFVWFCLFIFLIFYFLLFRQTDIKKKKGTKKKSKTPTE